MEMVKSFMQDESGATAIEYGLIAALVAVTCIVALRYLGGELYNTFNHVANQLAQGTAKGTP